LPFRLRFINFKGRTYSDLLGLWSAVASLPPLRGSRLRPELRRGKSARQVGAASRRGKSARRVGATSGGMAEGRKTAPNNSPIEPPNPRQIGACTAPDAKTTIPSPGGEGQDEGGLSVRHQLRSGIHGGRQCRGIVPPSTGSCHRNDVIIHGPIFAWGVGHRLSNPLKNPKSESPKSEGETWTRIDQFSRIIRPFPLSVASAQEDFAYFAWFAVKRFSLGMAFRSVRTGWGRKQDIPPAKRNSNREPNEMREQKQRTKSDGSDQSKGWMLQNFNRSQQS